MSQRLLRCVEQKPVLHAPMTKKEERMSINDRFINHILRITDKVLTFILFVLQIADVIICLVVLSKFVSFEY